MALTFGVHRVAGIVSASVADGIAFDSLSEDVRDLAARVLASRAELDLDGGTLSAVREAIEDLESAISCAEDALGVLRKVAK